MVYTNERSGNPGYWPARLATPQKRVDYFRSRTHEPEVSHLGGAESD